VVPLPNDKCCTIKLFLFLCLLQTLRKGATEQEKAEFLKEAQLMSNFKHEHILQLLGVCLDNDPNFIIMELMENGDLLSYLRSNRPLLVSNASEES
jgi:proto-oncogene tyrosine-protein kinase ROS